MQSTQDIHPHQLVMTTGTSQSHNSWQNNNNNKGRCNMIRHQSMFSPCNLA